MPMQNLEQGRGGIRKRHSMSFQKWQLTLSVTVVKAARVYEFDRLYTLHRLCQIRSWRWLCVVILKTKKSDNTV